MCALGCVTYEAAHFEAALSRCRHGKAFSDYTAIRELGGVSARHCVGKTLRAATRLQETLNLDVGDQGTPIHTSTDIAEWNGHFVPSLEDKSSRAWGRNGTASHLLQLPNICYSPTSGAACGRPYWIRTSDQRIKSPLLYQLS
jgi:hypothetical protein